MSLITDPEVILILRKILGGFVIWWFVIAIPGFVAWLMVLEHWEHESTRNKVLATLIALPLIICAIPPLVLLSPLMLLRL